MIYKYKNKNIQELDIPKVGIIKPNEEFESNEKIHNSNLELINNKVEKNNKTSSEKDKDEESK